MPKLTKRTVDAAKAVDKDAYLWDSELKGFGLRVKSSGVRSYILQYRNSHGTSRRLTLGKHGALTCEQARRMATEMLAAVRMGADPARDRMDKRQAPLMSNMLQEFIDCHVSQLKPLSGRNYTNIIRRDLLPKLGKLHVEAVTHADVAKLHREMKDSPWQANRCLAVLSKALSWAKRNGYPVPPGDSPTSGVQRYKEPPRKRFLSFAEIRALGEAMAAAEHARTEPPMALAALRLLMLTGCRTSEILTLRWRYVDFQHARLDLPDSKTGPKSVPLNAPAMALLAELPRGQGDDWVLPGIGADGRITTLRFTWMRLCKTAGIEDARIHDLRHSFASVGVGGGLSLPMIGELLGHRLPSTTARYAHLADTPTRAASEMIAQRIADALSQAEDDGDKVVTPFRA